MKVEQHSKTPPIDQAKQIKYHESMWPRYVGSSVEDPIVEVLQKKSSSSLKNPVPASKNKNKGK